MLVNASDVPNVDRVTRLREEMNRSIEQTRRRRDLTDEAKRVQIARAYVRARDESARLRDDVGSDQADRRRVLERRLFGVPSTPGADQATLVVSYRDAQDRASAVGDHREASDLLARAERSGDDLLARAVAAAANDRGWTTVLDEYLATRQAAARDFAELATVRAPDTSTSAGLAALMGLGIAHEIVAPPELSGLNDYAVDRLAASTVVALS